MAHTHPVVDSDSRFIINSTTRIISTTSDKLELIQGDHQSERITFEIPKIVEGHDMSLCDRIEIHYINIDKRTSATSRDVYIADDVAIDGDKLTFSWLISGNATKYYGRLNFIILFECLDPDGNYTYKWNTEICKLLTIGEGISNTSAVIEDHSDILEKFRNEILEEAGEKSIQPDWNQNDPTAKDYVKNRPFYTGDSVETVLVEESTVPFAENHGLYVAEFPSPVSATVGETYKVYWDGTVYECTCVDFDNKPGIGNLSIAGVGSDTGEPFVMQVINGRGIIIATKDTSASHTFSISGFVQEVVKIDEKYLPDTVATKSDVDNCIKTVNGTAPDESGNVEVQTISEDALSTNQYGTVIIVKNGVVFKNRLGQYTQMSIGESNVAFLVKEGKTSNTRDTIFAFAVATNASNGFSADQIHLSRNGIDFYSENVAIRSLKPGNTSVDVIQLNGNKSHGVMVEITKNACFVLPSSTAGSTKKFKITVDDSGTLKATEVTE